jgi:RNA polymerase sigma-70 factor (ECF subfamily)
MTSEVMDITSHRPAIVAFVNKLVGSPALAEDIAQETFLRATRKAAKFRGEASPQSWLSAIAMNLVRDHFRKNARLPETVDDPTVLETVPDCQDSSEQTILKQEMSSCIARYAAQLPHPQYDVVVLHDMAGLNHREIAAELDLSEANSRVLLHRGRDALRQILENNCVLSLGQDDIPCEPAPNNKSCAKFI